MSTREGPWVAEVGRVLTPEGDGSHWCPWVEPHFSLETTLPIKSSPPTLQPAPTRCRRLARRVHPQATLEYGSPDGNRRTWIETLLRRKREEAGSVSPSETPPPPLQLQTASDILRGNGPPPKEDPEKENNVRTWGAGVGGRGRKAGMALSVSEGLKTNNCVAVCICSINTAGP